VCIGYKSAKQKIFKHFSSRYDAVATHCETLFTFCNVLMVQHTLCCSILLMFQPIAAHFGNEIDTELYGERN